MNKVTFTKYVKCKKCITFKFPLHLKQLLFVSDFILLTFYSIQYDMYISKRQHAKIQGKEKKNVVNVI